MTLLLLAKRNEGKYDAALLVNNEFETSTSGDDLKGAIALLMPSLLQPLPNGSRVAITVQIQDSGDKK